jgi:predicted ATPase
VFGESGYRVTCEKLSECYYVDSQWQYDLVISRDDKDASVLSLGTKQLVKVEPTLPADQTVLALNPLVTPTAFIFRNAVEDWGLYHDLKVHQGADIRRAAVARVEKRIAPDGQNLIPVLHTLYSGNREFKKQLDGAMSAAFGDEYEELVFPPAEDQKINLRVRWKSLNSEQSAAALSDGTIRFLILLTILANPSGAELLSLV